MKQLVSYTDRGWRERDRERKKNDKSHILRVARSGRGLETMQSPKNNILAVTPPTITRNCFLPFQNYIKTWSQKRHE